WLGPAPVTFSILTPYPRLSSSPSEIASNGYKQGPIDHSVLEKVAEKIQAYDRHNRLLLLETLHDPDNRSMFQSPVPIRHMPSLAKGESCLHRLAREIL